MSDHLDSVKEYMRVMERWKTEAEAKGEDRNVAGYERRLSAFQATVEEVERLRQITKPIPSSYGDLSDLPPELVKELTGIKVDELEQQLYTIIKSGGDEVGLDAILIELFRRFSVLQTRKFLQNKLWRMAQKEVIFSVQGKKGVYSASAQPSGAKPFSFDLDDDVPF